MSQFPERCDLCSGVPELARSAVFSLAWWGGREIRAQICQYCALRIENLVKDAEAHGAKKQGGKLV